MGLSSHKKLVEVKKRRLLHFLLLLLASTCLVCCVQCYDFPKTLLKVLASQFVEDLYTNGNLLQVCRHHCVSYFICSTIICCQEQILPYVLYIQYSVRVMFITTDVIEILMRGGTLKVKNFQPIQIGKLFIYIQLVLSILRILVSIACVYNCS